MRAPLIAIALAGCGGPPPLCLSDSFDRGGLDARRWRTVEPANVTAHDGRLELALPAQTTTNVLAVTWGTFDLTGRAVSVDAAKYLAPSAYTQSQLALVSGGSQNIAIIAINTVFVFHPDGATAPNDPPARTWTIRHDESTNSISYETDGVVRHTVALPFPIQALSVQLEADAFSTGAAAPDVAAFANLRVGEAACTQGGEYDEHLGPYAPP